MYVCTTFCFVCTLSGFVFLGVKIRSISISRDIFFISKDNRNVKGMLVPNYLYTSKLFCFVRGNRVGYKRNQKYHFLTNAYTYYNIFFNKSPNYISLGTTLECIQNIVSRCTYIIFFSRSYIYVYIFSIEFFHSK